MMPFTVATFICVSLLFQAADAGVYDAFQRYSGFDDIARMLALYNETETNETNTSLISTTTVPPPTPLATPAPNALVQTISVTLTSVDDAPSTSALAAAAQGQCTDNCEVIVEREFKVSLTFDFLSYPCTGVSTRQVRSSIATTLDVALSAVTATVSVSGCRRLLESGERRLQLGVRTGAATVSSVVVFPDTDAGKAGVKAAMAMPTDTTASNMATALSDLTGVTINPPVLRAAPTLEVEQTIVVTPPVGQDPPAPLTTEEIKATLPVELQESFTSTVVTAAPTWQPGPKSNPTPKPYRTRAPTQLPDGETYAPTALPPGDTHAPTMINRPPEIQDESAAFARKLSVVAAAACVTAGLAK
jgi:hypothetical protein